VALFLLGLSPDEGVPPFRDIGKVVARRSGVVLVPGLDLVPNRNNKRAVFAQLQSPAQ
jgi:hypothetical protein